MRNLIRKKILSEMFGHPGKNSYNFMFRKQFNDEFDYFFTTDSGLRYVVTIFLTSLNYQDVWEIGFGVIKDHDVSYELTNEFDFKVLNTVIMCIKDFVERVLPNLGDIGSNIKNFTMGAQEEFKGDKRRFNIYLYILKKNGIEPSIVKDINNNPLIIFNVS